MRTDWVLAQKRAQSVLGKTLRYALLLGLSFIILYPFIAKICAMFMSYADTVDPTVMFAPRRPTLSNVTHILFKTKYFRALANTALVSALYAALTVASSMLAGYGLAKFRLQTTPIYAGVPQDEATPTGSLGEDRP